MMTNGYKPTPLDLSEVKLLPSQEILVDKLAENAHNVWAKERIKQGWTYGIQQVKITLRKISKKNWVIIKEEPYLKQYYWVICLLLN